MHYPETAAMTEERLREHMTLFGVRPGNCMVALERQRPVGVVVSARREADGWIQAIGCQPAVQRQGVASQLLEALLRKIAIQRVTDITVEVPEANTSAVKFFEAQHFERRERYVSYQGTPQETAQNVDAVSAAPAASLLTAHASFHTVPVCWERRAEALAAYGEFLQGYAYHQQGALQGYVLYHEHTLLDLALAPEADTARVSLALLSRLRAGGMQHVTLAKVSQAEPVGRALTQHGFTPTAVYIGMGQAL
jgi:GNAT superfamily N-acetyltransferase